MKQLKKYRTVLVLLVCIGYAACKTPQGVQDIAMKPLPKTFYAITDTSSSATINWKNFFSDSNLVALIDTALKNNIDLAIAMQDIEIARSDVRFTRGTLFPTVSGGGAYALEKVGRYTSQGAGDASTEITPGKPVPEVLPDYYIGLRASWEVDIWGKLHNENKAAYERYLATVEGRNFVITNLVAEVANSYYELLSLDNQLEIIRQNIALQKNELEIVKIQKEAALVSELAVNQFEAQLLNSQSMEFDLQQRITETENKINFLLGRFPQPVVRDKNAFQKQLPMLVKSGVPSQLLSNRPDIRRAECELIATKCDVKAARAEFYPSLSITGLLGFQGFNPSYLFLTPQSLAYSVIGDLTAPLINRSAIKAHFSRAKAEQVQAMYEYQLSILNGYVDVSNELSRINNLEQASQLKAKQVQVLTRSIDISTDLFKSARANYLEVLMTQSEALDSQLELIEMKQQQFNSTINLYAALGGGWK